MSGRADWLNDALCRRRGIPVTEFVPPAGGEPSERAKAACSACPVAAPCAADRGSDVGLRGDGFVRGTKGERVRSCFACGEAFVARGGGYMRCEQCSGAA